MGFGRPVYGQPEVGDRHEAVLVCSVFWLPPIVMDSEIAHMVYILVLVPCLFQPPCTVGTRAEDCCLFL